MKKLSTVKSRSQLHGNNSFLLLLPMTLNFVWEQPLTLTFVTVVLSSMVGANLIFFHFQVWT